MSRIVGLGGLGLVGVVLLIAALPLRADTIFANDFTNPKYSPGAYDGIVLAADGTTFTPAVAFTAAETATLTDVILPVSIEFGMPAVSLYIDSDVGGLPGNGTRHLDDH